MKTVVCKSYCEMSLNAAGIIAELVKSKPCAVLGLATGSTPEGMYKELSEMYNNGELDFSGITTVNLDEYYPIQPSDAQSYRYFMDHHLFNKVNVKKENTYLPDGLAKDVDGFCEAYDKLIDDLGGIDIQVLGIGKNGHIGFNEPGDFLRADTHLTELTEETIEANSRFFNCIDDVPKHAITMGLASIMKARKIILLANGKQKSAAVSALLKNKIDTQIPATMLLMHPDVILICDEDAYNG